MHYYSRNIPAYALDTSHLNMIEDGAYNRLIDMYYTQEAPISTDMPKLFRVLRARSEEEQQAVRIVLDEFFTLTEDGYTHRRCNKEIAAYHDKAAKNRVNGAKGGRPPKQETAPVTETTTAETQSVISGLPEQTLTVNRKPETVNQEEPTPTQPAAAAPAAPAKAEKPAKAAKHDPTFNVKGYLQDKGVSLEAATAWLKIRSKKGGVNSQYAMDLIDKEVDKAGYTWQDAVDKCVARNWIAFDANFVSDRRDAPRTTAVVVGVDAAPSRRPLNRQEQLEARNRAIAAEQIAEAEAEAAAAAKGN